MAFVHLTLLSLLAPAPPPQRSQAIADVVRALRTHPVVAIAESHGIAQAGDFYVALAEDPEFQNLSPDIVIEFASGQSQPLLDRYVLEGASLPPDSVASIWRNTTKVAAWESPIYARWLAAIRGANRRLAPGKRIRVLAGDTPVDWTALHAPADWRRLGDNNLRFADVIERLVIAQGRRALVVLGSNHLARTGDRRGGPNTTTRVNRAFPGSLYVIWLYTGRPGSPDASARMMREGWEIPSLHPLHGSWAGALPASGHRFDDVADALLYLGPPDSLRTAEAPASAFDPAYRRELDRRSWIEWGDSSRARRFLNLPGPPQSGRVETFEVPVSGSGSARRVWVYTPPGYPAACPEACDLLVTFDGSEYVSAMRVPQVLDSLIEAGKLPPTVALLIDDGTSGMRLADLANHAAFVRLLAVRLLPWLRGRWHVTTDPGRTIITGSSAGGLAAAYAGLARPDLFGNVLSQSGAFWRGNEGSNEPPYEWLTAQFAASPHRAVRFVLEVGAAESKGALGGKAPSILEANRRLRDVLTRKGYDVIYVEVPQGGHNVESWRVRFPYGLTLLGRRPLTAR